MSDKIINSTIEGHILTLEINRPKFLNALNRETIAELGRLFTEARENNDVKVIILTGSGDKAFVAGADIKEFDSLTVDEGKALSADGQRILFDVVENMNKPVIAAINGFALGGGLELALSCHIRVASEQAKLGLPEVSLGLIPGYGGTQRLAQIAGKGIAFEMITSGQMISTNEALRYGLLNYVVKAEELMDKSRSIANKIMKNSPIAISASMDAIRAGYEPGVNGYQAEIDAFGKCFGTEDFREGTAAFLEKRKANFKGQ